MFDFLKSKFVKKEAAVVSLMCNRCIPTAEYEITLQPADVSGQFVYVKCPCCNETTFFIHHQIEDGEYTHNDDHHALKVIKGKIRPEVIG